jgi:hypothetical protein
MATNKKKDERSHGALLDGVVSSIGRHVHIETGDGIYRDGRLSGIGVRTLKVNGTAMDWPIDLELNGDPSDRVPIERVVSIVID